MGFRTISVCFFPNASTLFPSRKSVLRLGERLQESLRSLSNTKAPNLSPVLRKSAFMDSAADKPTASETITVLYEPQDAPNQVNDHALRSVDDASRPVEGSENGQQRWFAYFKTRNFYIVLMLGYGGFNLVPVLLVQC